MTDKRIVEIGDMRCRLIHVMDYLTSNVDAESEEEKIRLEKVMMDVVEVDTYLKFRVKELLAEERG